MVPAATSLCACTWMQSLTFALPFSETLFQLNHFYWETSAAIIIIFLFFRSALNLPSAEVSHKKNVNKLLDVFLAALSLNWQLC